MRPEDNPSILTVGIMLAAEVAWSIAEDIFTFYEPFIALRRPKRILKDDPPEDFFQ
jgi:hypothetical protein